RRKAAWYRETLLTAYDGVGRTDPRWDADARRALAALIDYLTDNPLARADDAKAAGERAAAALAAGCDDPLIRSVVLQHRYYDYVQDNNEARRRNWDDDRRQAREVAAAVAVSQYPAATKAQVLVDVG